MEQLLYILLGAFLAAGGSFLAQRNQLAIDRRERDQKLIFEVSEILQKYSSVIDGIEDTSNDLSRRENQTRHYQLIATKGELLERLVRVSIQIASKKHRSFSVQITKFALHDSFRTPENLDELIRFSILLVNKEMIELYESEIREDPLELKNIT